MHIGVVALGVLDQPRHQRGLADRELAELLAPHAERHRGSGVRKKRAVAFTPYEPCPKYTVFRYCSRISRFEYLLFSRWARTSSFAFRWRSRLFPRIRFFTSCCVIVDPPWLISPLVRFSTNARGHR